MRSILCLSLLLLPLTTLAAQQEGAPQLPRVDLSVGAQRVLVLPRVVKVAVGDAAIVDVKTLGKDQVLLTGVGEGETTLRVWQAGDQVPSELKLRVARTPIRPEAEEEQVTLKLGAERTLTFAAISRISIGDTEIADVKPVGDRQLTLTAGKQVGSTTLIVWSGEVRKSILVHVVK